MDRFEDTKRAGIFGIFGNIFLLIIKGFVGLMSGSQAMIADAVNSAGDIFSSLMTFIGNKIASEPSDDNHNFGHGKAEYIFSLFVSIAMIVVAIKLLIDSTTSLLFGNIITFSWFLVVVCIVTIVTKAILYVYTRKLCENHNNILLKANMKDHRNDCIVTTFTLISVLLASKNITWFDGITGIGISIWIFYTGAKIFIESYNVLMDISIDETTLNKIKGLSDNHKDILEIEKISSTPVGYKYLVVITIAVDGNLSTFYSHDLADKLERDVETLDNITKAIVHVNPVKISD